MLWTPGQHVFLRFLTLGLHSLTAHPFSICSLPALPRDNRSSELVFYIRPRGGLTSRLAKIASKQPDVSIPVLLDGPYGGVDALTITKFDKALIIAGGSGAGYTLALVEDVARRFDEQEKGACLQARKTILQVIISTRDDSTRVWYQSAVDELLSRYPAFANSDSLRVSIYLTDVSSSTSSDPDRISLAETGEQTMIKDENGYRHPGRSLSNLQSQTKLNFHGRPNLPRIIHEATSEDGASVGIAVCGPASMLQDVRNASAAAQKSILGYGSGAKDVYLHTEHFSYVSNSPHHAIFCSDIAHCRLVFKTRT